jgi:hypothetical protein
MELRFFTEKVIVLLEQKKKTNKMNTIKWPYNI